MLDDVRDIKIVMLLRVPAPAGAASAAGLGGAFPGLGRLTPYLDRLTRRFSTPAASKVPRTM